MLELTEYWQNIPLLPPDPRLSLSSILVLSNMHNMDTKVNGITQTMLQPRLGKSSLFFTCRHCWRSIKKTNAFRAIL